MLQVNIIEWNVAWNEFLTECLPRRNTLSIFLIAHCGARVPKVQQVTDEHMPKHYDFLPWAGLGS